ncbi:hypothetical protein [Roseicyclus sp.]|uniref:hypothetical protein n=1 Tax=Roseicyclus sp. TaxID=1914329 RepID=UPI003F6ACCB1
MALIVATAAPVSGAVRDGAILQQSGQGRFVLLDASQPFAVGQDHFDDDNLYAFDEAQMITLRRPLAVDIGGTPAGVLPIGTQLASHYVFFDSIDSSHFAYVAFDAPILGVATQRATLAASDDLAGTAVRYLSPGLRGLETGDEVWIDPEDSHRLFLLWAGSSPGDYIRVFTAIAAHPGMM